MLCSSICPKLHKQNSGSRKLEFGFFYKNWLSYERLEIALEVEKKCEKAKFERLWSKLQAKIDL